VFRSPTRGLAAVYPPREDTALLVRAAGGCRGRTVLEIGTGSGAAAVAAARAGARRVVATDLNPLALRALRRNARAAGVAVEAVRTDLAAGLGRFDRVLANPPYLPTRAAERDPEPLVNLALDGGPDGCAVLARLLRGLPRHLETGGVAYVVVSSLQRASRRARLLAAWRARGGRARPTDAVRLEGETLTLWELSLPEPRRAARPSARSARGTRARRGSRAGHRPASSPAAASGRTPARGGASGRRRSPLGS